LGGAEILRVALDLENENIREPRILSASSIIFLRAPFLHFFNLNFQYLIFTLLIINLSILFYSQNLHSAYRRIFGGAM
jgi:hypothetical protein